MTPDPFSLSGIRRALVGLLPPPGRLLPLREIAHHVLALVPLTPLDEGPGPEHRLNGFAQPLGPVDDAEQAELHPQPPLHQEKQRGRESFLNGLMPISVHTFVCHVARASLLEISRITC